MLRPTFDDPASTDTICPPRSVKFLSVNPLSTGSQLVYPNASKAAATFSARLAFEMSLLKVDADDSWVALKLDEAKACLSDFLPAPAEECSFCSNGAAWEGACS